MDILNFIFTDVPPWLLYWIIGILAAQIYFQLNGRFVGFRWYKSLLFGVSMLLTEMIGAKFLYIAENFDRFSREGLTFGGFLLFGVFISVPVFLVVLSKLFAVGYGKLLDFSYGGILLELAFYRVGCFFTGCCGGPTVSFGVLMPDGTRRIPVQLIEAFLDLLIFAVIFYLYRNKKLPNGASFCLMLSCYGLLRFVLEFLRVRNNVFWELSVSHLLALTAFLVGSVVFFVLLGRSKNEKKNL